MHRYLRYHQPLLVLLLILKTTAVHEDDVIINRSRGFEVTTNSSSSSPLKELTSLTGDNFDAVVNKFKHVLVMFHASWCRHCQLLAPEFAIVASNLHESDDILVATVDGSVEHDLLDRYQIAGFPTLKLLTIRQPAVDDKLPPDDSSVSMQQEQEQPKESKLHGNTDNRVLEYRGLRKANDIVEWVKRHTEPRVKRVDTEDQLRYHVTYNQLTVLGVVSDQTKIDIQRLSDILGQVAGQVQPDTIQFLLSNKFAVVRYCNASQQPAAVIVFRKADERQFLLAIHEINSHSDDVIRQFVASHRLPALSVYNREILPFIAAIDVIGHVLLFANSSQSANRYSEIVGYFNETASAYHQELLFILFDVTVSDSRHILDSVSASGRQSWSSDDLPLIYYVQFGEAASSSPAAAVEARETAASMGEDRKYRIHGRLNSVSSKEQIRDFVGNIPHDKVTTDDQSVYQQWQLNNLRLPVKVFTSYTFHSVVKLCDCHVVVLFYSPACVHCQRLMPVWDKVGEIYATNDDVIIAKFDVTNASKDDIKISVVPTIRLYAQKSRFGSSSPVAIDYADERTADKISEFINSNLNTPLAKESSSKRDIRSEL